MTLRRKVLLIIGFCLLFSILVVYLGTHYFLRQNALQQEHQAVLLDIKRAEIAVNGRLTELARAAGDYSQWNDTYRFTTDRNNKYIQTNLSGPTFTNLKVSLFAFFDRRQRPLYLKCFDLAAGKEVPPPADLAEYLQPVCRLLTIKESTGNVQGLVRLRDGLLLVAAAPILPGKLKGPANGTLIVGRFLDEQLVEQFKEQVQVDFSLTPAGSAGSLEAGDPAFIESLRQKKYLVRPQDINWVAGYTLLSDLFGQPAAVVQVKVPRNIYRQGTVTTVYLAFILGTIGLLLVLGALLLLEKLILAPLTGLSSEVVRIGQHGDLTSRLSISGADELAALGRQINRMLNALTTAQTQQNESAKKFEKLFAATPDAIYLEKLDGTIVDCNKAASEATGYAKEELLKMNAADLVPAATAGLFPELVGDLHSTGSFFVVAENRRKDGTIFPVESSGRLIEIGGEKYAFVVARDISDRQRAEGQLREKLKELEDFHDTVIGRELKMIELEKEIDSLRRELEKGTKRP